MASSSRKPMRRVGLVGIAALMLVACTSDARSTASTPIASIADPVATLTTVAATAAPTARSTAASSTAAPTTAPTTTVVPTTSATASTATTTATTAPTTSSTTTTTTLAIAVQELGLTGDGIGSARFGATPEGVIEYVTSILGGNTGDTGWVDPLTFAVCDGTVARRVDWGVLTLLFSDLSDFANGRRHFMGYEYGRIGEIGDEPVGLRTPGGTTLGSRIVDLLADFPEAVVNPGEEGIDIPPNFYVSNNFYGLVTGVEAEDRVLVIFGGYGCGA